MSKRGKNRFENLLFYWQKGFFRRRRASAPGKNRRTAVFGRGRSGKDEKYMRELGFSLQRPYPARSGHSASGARQARYFIL